MSIDNLNIVLAGSNFPVETIRGSDFDFAVPIAEPVRLPMFATLQGGPYVLQVIPVRFQVSAQNGEEIEDKSDVLVRNALAFVENYIGPRAVTGVGHNFQSHLSTSEIEKPRIYRRLFGATDLGGIVGDSSEVIADLAVQFKRGTADFVRLSIINAQAPPDRIVVDLNFNFDVSAADVSAVSEAIECFPESLRTAQEILEELPTFLEMEDAR